MLGIVTTLSTVPNQPVDSQIELKTSTEYIINTLNITKLKVYSTTDSSISYKLNRNEDRSPEFLLRVDETNSAIQTLADTSAYSNMIALDVFLNEEDENCLTFAECAFSGTSTTTKYFNIDDIVWIEENNSGTKAMMYVCEGGWVVKKIFVDHNLDQIVDLLTTGTTTTTTTSTTAEAQ